MDLSVIHTNQQEMGIQNTLNNDYGNQLLKIKETLQETDVTGNNNLLDSIKTETNDVAFKVGSLFEGIKNNFHENKNAYFNHSPIKKAMDLRIHNRTNDDKKRTIFDDAEYFAKNYLYKLLPITFESVDETIIHTEHNYCHFTVMSSESENEEDCSRTMDYSWIKEKNYKKRKAKCNQSSNENDVNKREESNSKTSVELQVNQTFSSETNDSINFQPVEENSLAPLDLSAPLVQEEKTDHCLKEHQPSINSNNTNIEEKEDGGEFDSDKENLKLKTGCIEVTITRPDEKENYQPCDLFLNDIARLVPNLIGKDCSEVDILDRTCKHDVGIQKHRLYYIISESTWRLFQSTNERVILTNDQSLGRPAEKKERDERPTYLVFDQYSLAKCLADYCKETGGCFEYLCVEDEKEEAEDVEKVTEAIEDKMNKEENGDKEKEEPEENIENQKPVNKTENFGVVAKVEEEIKENTIENEVKANLGDSVKEEKDLTDDKEKQSNSNLEKETTERLNNFKVKKKEPEESVESEETPRENPVKTRHTKTTKSKTEEKPKPPVKKDKRLTKKVPVKTEKVKSTKKSFNKVKNVNKKEKTTKPVKTCANNKQKSRLEASASSNKKAETTITASKSKSKSKSNVASPVKTRSKSATSQKSDRAKGESSNKRKKECETESSPKKRRRAEVPGGEVKVKTTRGKTTEKTKHKKVEKKKKDTKETAKTAKKSKKENATKTTERKRSKTSIEKTRTKRFEVKKTLSKGRKR